MDKYIYDGKIQLYNGWMDGWMKDFFLVYNINP